MYEVYMLVHPFDPLVGLVKDMKEQQQSSSSSSDDAKSHLQSPISSLPK